MGLYRYRYDNVGNRTQKQHTKNGETNTEQYTYTEKGQGNRLTTVNTQGKQTRYAYHADGSTKTTGELRYEYNSKHRPIKVFKDKQLIAEYTYNRFGERIKKVVYTNTKKTKVTYYLYDGHTLTAEADETGVITTQYLYLNTIQPVIKLQGRDIYAIHSDHLGTPRNVTDENQKTVWQATYSPFGKAEIKTEQITLNLRLPGQYEDEETGTYYNYFRDYDPKVGRYRTSDPIGLAGGVNSYVYVTNNPLSMIDSLGLRPIGRKQHELQSGTSSGRTAEDGSGYIDQISDWASNSGAAVVDSLIGKDFSEISQGIVGDLDRALSDAVLADPRFEKPSAQLQTLLQSPDALSDLAGVLVSVALIDKAFDFVIRKPNLVTIVAGAIAKEAVLWGMRLHLINEYGDAVGPLFDSLLEMAEQIAELSDPDNYSPCDVGLIMQEMSDQLAEDLINFAIVSGTSKLGGFTNKLNFKKKKKKDDKGHPIDEAFKKYKGSKAFHKWFTDVAPRKFSVAKLRNYAKRNNWKKNGRDLYPPYDGFNKNEKTSTKIKKGWTITRYTTSKPKDDDGSFVSKGNVSFTRRALPQDKYNFVEYEVLKDMPAYSGRAMAWFDQPGGGKQYKFTNGRKIQYLINNGFLRLIEP